MKDLAVEAHGCRKTKKIICGMEGENVVAHGRLLFILSLCLVVRTYIC